MKRLAPYVMSIAAILALCAGCGGGAGEKEGKAQLAPRQAAVGELGSGVALLAWEQGAGGEGFVVERSSDGGLTWEEIARLDETTMYYVDAGLTGGSYEYRIGALDGEGGVAYALPVDLSVSAPLKPANPSRLKAYSTGQGEMLVKWSDNADNETGYLVGILDPDNGDIFIPLDELPADSTEWLLTELEPLSGHTFSVRAVNAAGQSTGKEYVGAHVRALPNHSVETVGEDGAVTLKQYDGDGLLATVSFDADDDGVFEKVTAYDQWGGVLSVTENGVLKDAFESVYTVDGDVLSIRINGTLMLETTTGGDGTETTLSQAVADAHGVHGADIKEVRTYGSRGELLARTVDYGNDSTIKESYSYKWDSLLNQVGYESNNYDGTGTPSYYHVELLSERAYYQVTDIGADGVIEYFSKGLPYGDGMRSVQMAWSDEKGAYDTITDITNANGDVISSEAEWTGDSNPETWYTRTYYQSGAEHTTISYRDDDSDGQYDYMNEIRFDEIGTLIYEATDLNGDGVIDYTL